MTNATRPEVFRLNGDNDRGEADQIITKALQLGIEANGTYLTIEYIYGFEYFNTRPYHNYENWAGGYRITDPRLNIVVETEDLMKGLRYWAKKVEEQKVEIQS